MAKLSDEKVASLTRRLVDTVIDYKKKAERLAIENETLRAALREVDEIGRVAAQVPGPRNKLMEICARARAALAAWPGMEHVFRQPHRLSVDYSKSAVILPLTTEKTDDSHD